MKNTTPNEDGTLTVYQYHPLTGQLIGTESAAPSPLERGKAWLIPAGATDMIPPDPIGGKIPVFDKGEWSLVQAPDPGQNLAILAAKKDEVSLMIRARRNELLYACDYTQLKDAAVSADWVTYRQALRDVTKQVGFPENVIWPTSPTK